MEIVKKMKVVVEQSLTDDDNYVVTKLTNRLLPKIGEVIDKRQLQELINEDSPLTVEILPYKRRRHK